MWIELTINTLKTHFNNWCNFFVEYFVKIDILPRLVHYNLLSCVET